MDLIVTVIYSVATTNPIQAVFVMGIIVLIFHSWHNDVVGIVEDMKALDSGPDYLKSWMKKERRIKIWMNIVEAICMMAILWAAWFGLKN